MALTTIYIIDSTDGLSTFAIQPRTFDGLGGVQSNTDLTLYGNSTPNWGERFNENFFKLLENFSIDQNSTFNPTATTPPVPLTSAQSSGSGINNPVAGQLWFNKSDLKMYMYTGTSWKGATTASTTQAVDPVSGDLWFDGLANVLNVWNGTAWLATAIGSDFVNVAGDTMTNFLTLHANPTAPLHAATMQYVDNATTGLGFVSKSGDTMTNFLTLHANPTAPLHAATMQYVDGLTTAPGTFVAKTGDSMSGELTITSSGASTGSGDSAIVGEGRFGLFVTTTGTDSGGILIKTGDNNNDEHAVEVVNFAGARVFSLRGTNGNMQMYGTSTHQSGSRLFLSQDPMSELEAATKQYVDDTGGVAVGYVLPFPVNSTPTGFLKCNGAAVSRTTYAALFSIIGTSYGAGNGSTTFNVPDLRGEFIRGWDDGRGIDSGRGIGSFQSDDFKSHTHEGQTGFHGNPYFPTFDPRVGFGGGTPDDSTYKYNTGATGGADTRPRNVAMLYCIKF